MITLSTNEMSRALKALSERTSLTEAAFTKMMDRINHQLKLLSIIKKLLMKRILTARHSAATVISNCYKDWRVRKELKEKAVVIAIITRRCQAAWLIQLNFKRNLNSKRYHCLYERVKQCYSIYPSIANDHSSVQMKVFLGKGSKVFRVDYCSLRKAFAIDIPKAKLSRRRLMINFIVNDEVVIDSTLCVAYEKGQAVNVIDFDFIQNKEEMRSKQLLEVIVSYSKRKWSTNESSTTNADELHFDVSDNDEVHLLSSDLGVMRRAKGMNTVQGPPSQMLPLRSTKRHMTEKTGMSIVKSILKPCMSTSSSGRSLNLKKVCFGKVEFSF